MTRRRFILMLVLVLSLTAQASAATSYPLIITVSPFTNILGVTTVLHGFLIDRIPDTNTYLLNVPALPSALLASLLGIRSMELNTSLTLPEFIRLGLVRVPSEVPADWYKDQPAMVLIQAGPARDYSTGRGVVIADLNSKVDTAHAALIGHLTGGYDFVATKPAGSTSLNQSSASFMDQSSASFMDQSSASFMDQFSATLHFRTFGRILGRKSAAYSHGTLCAGIMAAIAPDSMIMPLRVFDDDGKTDIFTLAKAVRWGVQHGAQVINMSFGTLENSSTLKSAVDFALDRNVLLVASAGNNATSAPQYPAAYTGVMTTAATDLLDRKASFSNYGPFVFVDAPGVNIFSSYPGGKYSVVSGTSFSAPAVAATAALVRSLRVNDVANSVAGGAVNIDSRNPDYARQLGYGRIDALRAIGPN